MIWQKFSATQVPEMKPFISLWLLYFIPITLTYRSFSKSHISLIIKTLCYRKFYQGNIYQFSLHKILRLPYDFLWNFSVLKQLFAIPFRIKENKISLAFMFTRVFKSFINYIATNMLLYLTL